MKKRWDLGNKRYIFGKRPREGAGAYLYSTASLEHNLARQSKRIEEPRVTSPGTKKS